MMTVRVRFKTVHPNPSGKQITTREAVLPGSLGSSPSESAVISHLKTKDGLVKKAVEQGYDVVIEWIK